MAGITLLLFLIGLLFLGVNAEKMPPRVLHDLLGYKFELEDLRATIGEKISPTKVQLPNPSNYMYLWLGLEGLFNNVL